MRPRWMHFRIGAGVLAACVAGSCSAHAQSPRESGSPAAKAQSAQAAHGKPASGGAGAPKGARPRSPAEIYKEAVHLYKKGQYEQALAAFQEVWAVEPKPKVAGNIGRTELKLSRFRDAAEHLALFLNLDTDMSPEDRKDVEMLLAEAKARITTLRFVVRPDGAEVFVDGMSKGLAPIAGDVFVESGHHTIEARTPKATDQAVIDTRPGDEEVVTLTVQEKVVVKPPPPPPPPPQTSSSRLLLLVTGTGVAVAGLGLWAGAWAGQTDKDRQLAAICSPGACPGPEASDHDFKKGAWMSLEHDRATLARLSLAGLVVGSAAGAATLGYFVLGPKKQETATGVRVSVAPGGVLLFGAW